MATLDEQIEALTKRLDERDRQPLVAEVAAAKGLPPGLAKRLRGTSRAELEADADELLRLVGGTPPAPPGAPPKEKLRPGADADDQADEDFDAEKVAAAVRSGRGGRDPEIEKVADEVMRRRGF